jgi:hypothetical protein
MVSLMSNLGKNVVSIEGALVALLTALLLGLWTVKDTFEMSATFVTVSSVYLIIEAAFVVYGWYR